MQDENYLDRTYFIEIIYLINVRLHFYSNTHASIGSDENLIQI